MNDIRPIETDYETEDGNSIFYNRRTDSFGIEIQQQELKSVTEEELRERMDEDTFKTLLEEYQKE
ncbi:MAG: hypothetical protein ABEK36_01800 [Candidatus Aenigmatarchaeota archaeon]